MSNSYKYIRWIPVLFWPAFSGLAIWFIWSEYWDINVLGTFQFIAFAILGMLLSRYRWFAHLWGERPIKRPFSD